MSDQKQGDEPSAAGSPDPAPADAVVDASTVDAPARWSGSAAVPPPGPKKSRFARRQALFQPEDPAAANDDEDWKDVTPVDPWAGLDTAWEAYPLAPESPLPPTRVEQAQAPAVPPPTPPQWAPTLPGAPTGMPPTAPAWAPPTATPPWLPPGSPQSGQYWAPPAQNGWAPQNGGQAAPPPAAPAPAPPKKTKAKRSKVQPRPPAAGRPLPPPPSWAAPKNQRPLPPPPRRKKRHWGRRFLLFTLLLTVGCCGLPLAYFQFPTLRQYPVTAVLPKTFADLQRRDDDDSKQAAENLAEQLRGPHASTRGVFTGVYGDDAGKSVTVFGVTGFRLAPGTDVRTQLDRVAEDVDLTGVQTFNLGEAGAHERCGVGNIDDRSTVVCSWADHGSLATVLLTRRSVDDSAALVAQLRSAVLTPLH
jgi:hypothetical protein